MTDQIIDAILITYKEVVGGEYPDQTTLRDHFNSLLAEVNFSDVNGAVALVTSSAFDYIRSGGATNPNETRFKDTLKGKFYPILGGE